jgi:hypothetical protein
LKLSSRDKTDYRYFLVAKIGNRDTTRNHLILKIKSIHLHTSFNRKKKITKNTL